MMVLVLNKKTAPSLKKALRAKRKSSKGFNAKKFNGIMKLEKDAMKTQRKLRENRLIS